MRIGKTELSGFEKAVKFSKPKNVNVDLSGIKKANPVGKILLSSLGIMGTIAVALMHIKNEEVIKSVPKDTKPPKDSGSIGSGDDSGHLSFGDDDNDGKNPGFDGETTIVLLQRVDGGVDEIYQLSDGRYIWPADFHFPHGRSLDELAFWDLPRPIILDVSIPELGSSDSKVKTKSADEAEEIILDEVQEDELHWEYPEEEEGEYLYQ